MWDGLLKEVSALIPATIELDEFTAQTEEGHGLRPRRFSLKGRVVSGGDSAHGSVSQFVESLERSVFFRDVALVSSELHSDESGKTSFDIEGMLE